MNFFAAMMLVAAAAAQTPAAALDDPRVATVELVSLPGDRMSVRARGPDGADAYGIELDSVRDALAVLADRRLAALWPAVTDFAGRDLERQRARLLARAAEEARAGLAPASTASDGDWALPAHRRFDAMSEVGRIDEGLGEVRAAFARNASGRSRFGGAEVVLRAGVASELASQGRVDEALAFLDAGEKSRRAAKNYRGDYRSERAAILAEAGRHSEALRWVDSARAQALKVDKDADSQVRFAWVRACALAGLGRAAESETEYRRVEASAPAIRLRLRALACMGDEDRLAAELIGQLGSDEMPSRVALMLRMAQVSPSPWARPFARAAERPDVRAALDARSRPLPAEMIPALRGWAGD